MSPFLWCSDNRIFFFQEAKTTFLGGRNQHGVPTLQMVAPHPSGKDPSGIRL